MADRLLRKNEIAAMLGTSPGVAISILSERGCHPIDFGYGRARGPRWLESAVLMAIRAMHEEAQPQKDKNKNIKAKHIPRLDLANMKTAELYALLTREGLTQ